MVAHLLRVGGRDGYASYAVTGNRYGHPCCCLSLSLLLLPIATDYCYSCCDCYSCSCRLCGRRCFCSCCCCWWYDIAWFCFSLLLWLLLLLLLLLILLLLVGGGVGGGGGLVYRAKSFSTHLIMRYCVSLLGAIDWIWRNLGFKASSSITGSLSVKTINGFNLQLTRQTGMVSTRPIRDWATHWWQTMLNCSMPLEVIGQTL